MLANDHWRRRRARLAAAAPEATCAVDDPLCAAEALRGRARAGNLVGVEALLDAPYDAVVAEAALGCIVHPAIGLDPAAAGVASVLLDAVAPRVHDPGHAWHAALDALYDRVATLDVIAAPDSLLTHVAALRAREAARAGVDAHAARGVQQVLRIAQTLSNANSVGMVRAQAEQAAVVPLSPSMLPLVAAHLLPLERLPHGQADIAGPLLANLRGWQDQVVEARRAWARERAAARDLVVPPDAEGFEDAVAAREELTALAAGVEAASLHDPVALPPPLLLDRALSDIALALVEKVLPRWWEVPEVAVSILAVLSASRTARPFALACVREHLSRDDLDPAVVRALVGFAASFLTGMTQGEAWLGSEGVTRVVEGDADPALDDVDALMEADEALRGLLWDFAGDATRDAPAREAATLAVLGAAPTDRIARLQEALARDPVCQRAALAWVIDAREHAAFTTLRAWEPPASLRPSWTLAVASTGDLAALELLSPRVLAGDADAERALNEAGARIATQQLRWRREIGQRASQLPALRERVHAASAREHAALDGAFRASLDLARAQARATSLAFDARAVAAEAAAESARHQLRLVPLLEEAAAITGLLRDAEGRLEATRRQLRGFRKELSDAAGAGARCQEETARQERRRVELRNRDERLGGDLDRLARELRQAETRVRDAARSAEHAASEASGATSPEGAASARASAERAASRLAAEERTRADVSRRLDRAAGELDDVREAARSCARNLERLDAEARALAETVAALDAEVAAATRRVSGLHAQVDRLEAELRRIQGAIAGVRREAATAARDRDRRLTEAQTALADVLATAEGAHVRERAELAAAEAARDERVRGAQELQRLVGLDMAALEAHERAMEPAARELAQRDVDAARASLETLRRGRARQQLALGTDILYTLLHRIDGWSPAVRPVARRLGIDTEET